ncbi:fimbrial protein [Citrobacter amalonaticus]|uniref:fimbrial protein n=1 Tax=Citrobacter amalonaticus TaxID=35703 RepID=UPI00076AFCFD|nr:fimbrial protein [Citrobacter amalonaticus]AMG94788.1 hypothetical protein AL479_20900 [Citrobacter amalonaticus]HED1253885.1 fimbrial protein [Citrobacter amalonaticus]
MFLKLYRPCWLFLLIGVMTILMPVKSHAFGCDGATTVYVDLTLTDSNEMALVSDMSTYTTCHGNIGNGSQNDALRTKTFTISNELAKEGYMGYFQTPTSTYPDTTAFAICVWPVESDVNCDPLSGGAKSVTEPLAIKIYVKRVGITIDDDLILKAGTEIARLSLDQRSASTWGWTRTWIFILKNDVPIPVHTCDLDPTTPAIVPLESIANSSLPHQGSTSEATDFAIKLNCQGNVAVSVLLDGTEDQDARGKGVLANNSAQGDSSGVGLQILFNNNPAAFDETFYTGTSSMGGYSIPMQVRYYKTKATQITAGKVSASMVYTLSYK